MRFFRYSFLALSISLSAFFIQPSLHAISPLDEVVSVIASCYVLHEYAALGGELANDIYKRPTNWGRLCKRGILGTSGTFPWIPSCALALYTLTEIASRYFFTKSSIIGTLDKKRKKHKTLYNGSKIAMAVPILSFWSKKLYSERSNALTYAKGNPIAPLSLYLAGSHCLRAVNFLFPHLFLH